MNTVGKTSHMAEMKPLCSIKLILNCVNMFVMVPLKT